MLKEKAIVAFRRAMVALPSHTMIATSAMFAQKYCTFSANLGRFGGEKGKDCRITNYHHHTDLNDSFTQKIRLGHTTKSKLLNNFHLSY